MSNADVVPESSASVVGSSEPPESVPYRRTRIAALDQLTPGDFAAVKRQADILGSAPDAHEFLAQLEAEHRIKPEVRENRGMGFLQ